MTSFLERLTDLEAKATPGPFTSRRFDEAQIVVLAGNLFAGTLIATLTHGTEEASKALCEADAELFKLLRNAVPEVKALIEAAQKVTAAVNAGATNAGSGLSVLGPALIAQEVALDALNRLEVN